MTNTKIDFTGNRNKYLIFSGILLAVIVVFMFIFGVNLDIQFKGGSIITYSYEGDLNLDELGSQIDEITGANVSLQRSESIATGQQTVIVTMPGNRSLSSDELMAITERLGESFAGNNLQTMEISNVDPTIGGEFLAKCLVAVAVASLLMVVYVAFRFRKIGGLSAGCMAVLALIHDVTIVFGVFVIFRIPLNDNFIAVVLTILGYSLNDTIVIYDRIRENKRLYGEKFTLSELVDRSINQSFKRTLNTTITTVLSMVVVTVVALIYSVESILTFSFPMILGLISGVYSSVCIAGPLWVRWREYRDARA